MQPQVYSGARVTVSFNSSVVAAGHVASYSIATMATAIETIDNVFPVEIAPERIRVSMDLRVYRTPENDPVVMGFAPGSASVGSDEQRAFLSARYLMVEIKDSNDKTVLCIPKAWMVSRAGSLSAQDLVTENWSILGIGYFGPQS